MNRINSKHILTVLMMCVVTICIAITYFGKLYECTILTDDDYKILDEWTLESDGSQIELPMNFKDTGEKIVLTKVLNYTHKFEDIPYMLMMSKYYDYSIYLEDEIIYTYINPKNGFTRTTGAQIRIPRLGEDIIGKQLRIEITPLLGKSIKYPVTPPLIGSKADIIWHSVKMEQPEVVLDIFVILFGCILVILYFLLGRTNVGSNLFFLGAIMIACGVYMGCQFRVSYIMATNSYILYYVEFTLLSIIPFLISVFIYNNLEGNLKKYVKC